MWKADSTGLLTVEGSELKLHVEDQWARVNAIWLEPGEAESCRAWRLAITGGKGMWVGVSTEDRLAPDYRLRGMMYGGPGNLSDGGCLVTMGWGPSLREGDIVDMKVCQEADRVTVEYGRNGFYLGVAFDIEGWNGGTLRPVVTLGNGDSLNISKLDPAEFPDTEEKLGDEVVCGVWVSEESEGRSYTLSVGGDETLRRVCAHVANSISCTLKYDPEKGVLALQGGSMMTTLIGCPSAAKLESSVTNMLQSIRKISRSGPQLVVTTDTASHKFNRAPRPGRATRKDIRWIDEDQVEAVSRSHCAQTVTGTRPAQSPLSVRIVQTLERSMKSVREGFKNISSQAEKKRKKK